MASAEDPGTKSWIPKFFSDATKKPRMRLNMPSNTAPQPDWSHAAASDEIPTPGDPLHHDFLGIFSKRDQGSGAATPRAAPVTLKEQEISDKYPGPWDSAETDVNRRPSVSSVSSISSYVSFGSESAVDMEEEPSDHKPVSAQGRRSSSIPPISPTAEHILRGGGFKD